MLLFLFARYYARRFVAFRRKADDFRYFAIYAFAILR